MKRDLGTNREASTVSLADRGMAQSGAAVKQGMDLTSAFNRSAAEAAQTQEIDLASIARKRLEQDQAYNTQKLLLQVPQA
jgi:hypothetical protein